MRTTLLTLAALLALLVALPSCAWSPAIRSDWDTSVDFSRWHTWAWAPDLGGAGSGSVAVSLHDARIRRSVEAALLDAGYRNVDPAAADFLVTYHVQVTEKQDVTVWDSPRWDYHWRREWRPAQVEVHNYTMGSLILDVVQTRSGNVAWRGWAEAQLERDIAPTERERRIDLAVREILARFPPR